jgi:glycosyltransferase involved in cell wall biosynthesis
MKINILFLSEMFYPYGGGAELATYLYAKKLCDLGHKVIVVTNKYKKEPDISTSNSFTIYRYPLFESNTRSKFSILLKDRILYSDAFTNFFQWADAVYIPRYWFNAVSAAKKNKKPVVVHLHDYINICPIAVFHKSTNNKLCDDKCSLKCIYSFERMKHGPYRSIISGLSNRPIKSSIKNLINLSDSVICVSNFQKNLILKYVPELKNKIKVIYNPLPEIKFNKMIGDDFGYFGGTNPRKGIYLLLNSLIYRKKNNFKTIKVHATMLHNFQHENIYNLEKLNVKPYKRLYGEEFERLNNLLKAVIVPSTANEPLPYVVSESVLKGKLVIASDIGGIPELLTGLKGVELFDPLKKDSYIDLANKIEIINNYSKEYIGEITNYNIINFNERYDQNAIMNSMVHIFQKIIERS